MSGDQARYITRGGSVIVLSKIDKRAIVVSGVPEPSVRQTFAAMGWSLVAREEVD